jgi:hypothetical protein
MQRFTLEGRTVSLTFRLAFPTSVIKSLSLTLKCNFNFSKSVCLSSEGVNDKVSYEVSEASERVRSPTPNAGASTPKACVLTL